MAKKKSDNDSSSKYKTWTTTGILAILVIGIQFTAIKKTKDLVNESCSRRIVEEYFHSVLSENENRVLDTAIDRKLRELRVEDRIIGKLREVFNGNHKGEYGSADSLLVFDEIFENKVKSLVRKELSSKCEGHSERKKRSSGKVDMDYF